MARITVEDCIDKIPNRFQLILLAAERARQINNGAETTMNDRGDRHTVMALREVADGQLEIEGLENSLIGGLQKIALQENLHDEENAFDEQGKPLDENARTDNSFDVDVANFFKKTPKFEDFDFKQAEQELGEMPSTLAADGL